MMWIGKSYELFLPHEVNSQMAGRYEQIFSKVPDDNKIFELKFVIKLVITATSLMPYPCYPVAWIYLYV